MRYLFYRLFPVALATALCSCAGAQSGIVPASGLTPHAASYAGHSGTSGNYIKHIVIIVQENHSFDNLFATFPGADGATTGKMSTGKTIKLKKSNLYSPKLFENSRLAFTVDYDNGKMDGWNKVYVGSKPCPKCAYAYVDPAQIAPYWTMAQQYALADHMFTTESSGSFTAHQDLIRGNTAINSTTSLIDFPSRGPWGCDAPAGATVPEIKSNGNYVQSGPFPCSNAFGQSASYNTLRDLLDGASVSWKYYTPALFGGGLAGAYWDAFDVIAPVRYGSEWKANIVSPEKAVLSDASKGKLPSVAWVIPDGINSDHSGFGKLRQRPVVGCRRGQCDRPGFGLELHRHYHPLGRLGRLVRSCGPAAARLRRSGIPRTDDRRLAVRQARLRFEHAIRVRQRRQIRRRSVRLG